MDTESLYLHCGTPYTPYCNFNTGTTTTLAGVDMTISVKRYSNAHEDRFVFSISGIDWEIAFIFNSANSNSIEYNVLRIGDVYGSITSISYGGSSSGLSRDCVMFKLSGCFEW
jgi:hypothetical protein